MELVTTPLRTSFRIYSYSSVTLIGFAVATGLASSDHMKNIFLIFYIGDVIAERLLHQEMYQEHHSLYYSQTNRATLYRSGRNGAHYLAILIGIEMMQRAAQATGLVSSINAWLAIGVLKVLIELAYTSLEKRALNSNSLAHKNQNNILGYNFHTGFQLYSHGTASLMGLLVISGCAAHPGVKPLILFFYGLDVLVERLLHKRIYRGMNTPYYNEKDRATTYRILRNGAQYSAAIFGAELIKSSLIHYGYSGWANTSLILGILKASIEFIYHSWEENQIENRQDDYHHGLTT